MEPIRPRSPSRRLPSAGVVTAPAAAESLPSTVESLP